MVDQQNWMQLRTCVAPNGKFVCGLHRPHFTTLNLREADFRLVLGQTGQGEAVENRDNFPAGDVDAPSADPIYEVANPLPFRGTTFIGKRWADAAAADPTRIAIASPMKVSLTQAARRVDAAAADMTERLFAALPDPLRLALATTSTDPVDLRRLAETTCQFVKDEQTGLPTGVVFAEDERGRLRPKIFNLRLYKAVANNPYLDIAYRQAMVLRPGIQGDSEIVGEWGRSDSHVFEYLRCNSYIPWGHFAANMAHDSVRYSVGDLTPEDVRGMRHLYYQRTYARMAQELQLDPPTGRRALSVDALEALRRGIVKALPSNEKLRFSATLWGWNYGFDYAPTGYRLHGSHQQIHQQFALIPSRVAAADKTIPGSLPAYACGDLVHDFVEKYRARTGRSFFDCYHAAIDANARMDGRMTGPSSLVVYQDDNVMLFVPKAQTSQWELQLMPKQPVGHILEADTAMRQSLDEAILTAMRILTRLGAAMITVIEYSRRFDVGEKDQRLLYAFLPRLPESPGAFSEAQLRWINGHYPEDFALVCRLNLEAALGEV
jgi:hypothetical protein